MIVQTDELRQAVAQHTHNLFFQPHATFPTRKTSLADDLLALSLTGDFAKEPK
jgi:hypothetical protein